MAQEVREKVLSDGSKAPFFGNNLDAFSTAGDTCRKEVMVVCTSSGVVWVHLVSILEGHTMHTAMISMCVRGGQGPNCHKQRREFFGLRSPSCGDKNGLITWNISSSFGEWGGQT